MSFITVKSVFNGGFDSTENISDRKFTSDYEVNRDLDSILDASVKRNFHCLKNLKQKKDCSPLDKNRPLILKLLDVLGIQQLCKWSSGDYVVVPWRIAPMMISLAFLFSHIVYFYVASVKFSLGTWILTIDYSVAASYSIFIAFMGLVNRNKYCKLLTSLIFSSNRQWFRHPNILSFLYIIYGVKHILLNGIVDGNFQCISIEWHSITSAICNPFLPALADLQLFWILKALGNEHDFASAVILQLIEARGTCEGDPLLLPEVSGRKTVKQRSALPTIEEISRYCIGASHRLDQFNNISRHQVLFRCAIVLTKMTIFGFMITRSEGVLLYILSFHMFDEMLRFTALCAAADHLYDEQSKMMDALMKLGSLTQTSQEDKILSSLTSRLDARPAHISVGGFGVLGRHLLGNFLNITVTYSVILYQSVKPEN